MYIRKSRALLICFGLFFKSLEDIGPFYETTYGDVSSRFQSQSGQPHSCLEQKCYLWNWLCCHCRTCWNVSSGLRGVDFGMPLIFTVQMVKTHVLLENLRMSEQQHISLFYLYSGKRESNVVWMANMYLIQLNLSDDICWIFNQISGQ